MADLEATSMHTATVYQLAVESVIENTKLHVAKKIIVSLRGGALKVREISAYGHILTSLWKYR